MELPRTPRTPRRALLHHAINGMACLDITTGQHRSTTSPALKRTWFHTALDNPAHRARTGTPLEPAIATAVTDRGAWRCTPPHTPGAHTTLHLGPRPMTDLDLALMTAQTTRIAGIPHDRRPAAGPVHDRTTIMIMTSALAAHDEERAHQFHNFCTALHLTTATPAGGWPWDNA